MKTLILCLLLLGSVSSGHSQILLKEAKVDYRPESMKLDPNSSTLLIKINEKVVGEFQNDPLQFMKTKFDIKKFVSDNKDLKYNEYQVNFQSRKGILAATFHKDGELISSVQRFKGVRLPEQARLQILEKHRGAAILGNTFYASTNGWDVNKAYYKVKIKDGNKTRRVRVDKDREQYSLAGL